MERLRRHLRTGRPLGDAAFIARLETRLDRRLHPLKPGPNLKPKRDKLCVTGTRPVGGARVRCVRGACYRHSRRDAPHTVRSVRA